MFFTECPKLDRGVVVLDHQIDAWSYTDAGTLLDFRCECGAWSVHLTGPDETVGRVIFHQNLVDAA